MSNFLDKINSDKREGAGVIVFKHKGKRYFAILQKCIYLADNIYYPFFPQREFKENHIKTTNLSELIKWVKIEQFYETSGLESDVTLYTDIISQTQVRNAKEMLRKNGFEGNEACYDTFLNKMVSEKSEIMKMLLEKTLSFYKIKFGERPYEMLEPTIIDQTDSKIQFTSLYEEDDNIIGKLNKISSLEAEDSELVYDVDEMINNFIIRESNQTVYDAFLNAIQAIAIYGCEETFIRLM